MDVRRFTHPILVTAGLVLATLPATMPAAPPAGAAPTVKASVDITSLPQTSTGTDASPTISGKATSPTGQVRVLVDGTEAARATVGSRGAWSARVYGLALGTREICAEVRSDSGERLAVDCVSYTVRPDVARFDVTWPLEGIETLTLIQPKGTCQDGTTVLVSLDGGDQSSLQCSGGDFWIDYLTTEGPHTFTAVLTYEGQVLATITRSYTATAPPAVDVEITSPADSTTVSTSAVRVEGTTNEPGATVTLTVNGEHPREPYINPDGSWWDGMPLQYGDNLVCATTSDLYGTSDQDCVTVTFAIDPDELVLTSPVDGDVSGPFVSYEGACHVGTQLRIELDGVVSAEDTCYYDHFGGSLYYVPDGPHTVTVTMLWEGLPISTVSAGVAVDTLAPAPPTVLTPAPGSTVRSVPLVLTGTAESGSTVELVAAGSSTVLAVPVAADGTWSMALDRAYLESLGVLTGQRESLYLRLTTVDRVGNRSYTTVVTYTARLR